MILPPPSGQLTSEDAEDFVGEFSRETQTAFPAVIFIKQYRN